MARGTIASFVAALCACAVAGVRAEVRERFDIDIRLRVDPSISSRRITDHLKSETEALWEPYGIRLNWTDASGSDSAAHGVSLDASVERQRRERVTWPAVLGHVVVGPDPRVSQPIRVSFDATEHALALRRPRLVSLTGIVLDRDLARALGRVLAHEMGHVLLGAYHEPEGLMRAALPADELADPDRTPFRLTCGGAERIRSRLRGLTGDPQPEHHDDSTALDLEGDYGVFAK